MLGHGRRQLLFGGKLDSRVERQNEAGSLLWRAAIAVFRLAVGRAPRVGQKDVFAGLSTHDLVVEVLEAFEAVVLHSHEAEDRGRKISLGIEALRVGNDLDAGNLGGAHGRRLRHLELRNDRYEAPGARQPRRNRRLGHARQAGQRPRSQGRVLDLVGRRVHGRGLDRHRELAPVSVEDGAAPRRNLHPLLLLPLRPGAVLAALSDLELHEAHRYDGPPEQQPGRKGPEPPALEAVHRLTFGPRTVSRQTGPDPAAEGASPSSRPARRLARGRRPERAPRAADGFLPGAGPPP